MIDQLPKQGGGQLLPFKGSIDRLPPACSRNAPTAAPAGRSEHHQTLARPRTDFPFRLPVKVTTPQQLTQHQQTTLPGPASSEVKGDSR